MNIKKHCQKTHQCKNYRIKKTTSIHISGIIFQGQFLLDESEDVTTFKKQSLRNF